MSFNPVFAAAIVLFAGCSSGDKPAGPPRPGTIAHSWYSAGEAYKAGDYSRAMQHLADLATKNREYRERARYWLIVVAGGVADGYRELANAYDSASKQNRTASWDYSRKTGEIRTMAGNAALTFAENVRDVLKEPKFNFDFGFPTGSAAEPSQMVRLNKGLTLQAADHEAARQAAAQRGVVRFAAALAGAPNDPAKAAAQFANPPRDAVLAAIAQNLLSAADLYANKKLDMPRRGNALCKVAMEAVALLPNGKERQQLESKAKEELKRFKVEA
jgi:hypothetical protein